jgi:hypothetical protein
MGHPNEPRRMTPRGDGKRAGEFDHVSGNAGRDGFTRVARRRPPGQPEEGASPFFMNYGGDSSINPPVGERDYGRGPRFSEDY